MKTQTPLIAVIAGGDSSEYEISIKSGKETANWLRQSGFRVVEIELSRKAWTAHWEGEFCPLDKNDFSFTHQQRKYTIEYAYIMIHGTPGENGLLQSYFDLIGLPYSSSSAFVSALTFNKEASKAYLQGTDIRMARGMLINRYDTYAELDILAQLGLPVFVKPNCSGSSFGVTKVKSAEALAQAIELAFTEGEEVLIEAALQGMEVDCGVLEMAGHLVALPLTEIVSENEFFDYEAKYLGKSSEITPARLSPETTEKVQLAAKKIYRRLGCKGIVRIDFMVQDEEPYFMEINGIPGMSQASIIPQQIKAAGMDVPAVLGQIVKEGLAN